MYFEQFIDIYLWDVKLHSVRVLEIILMKK